MVPARADRRELGDDASTGRRIVSESESEPEPFLVDATRLDHERVDVGVHRGNGHVNRGLVREYHREDRGDEIQRLGVFVVELGGVVQRLLQGLLVVQHGVVPGGDRFGRIR